MIDHLSDSAPEDWLERRDYPDLPLEAEQALRKAALAWESPKLARDLLSEARTLAPEHIKVHIATYRFLFYTHDYDDAAEAALKCINLILERRQIHKNLIELCPEDAPFDEFDPEVRLLMNAIMAYGYCLLRQGDFSKGRPILDLLAKLDTNKQTSVLSLISIANQSGDETDED